MPPTDTTTDTTTDLTLVLGANGTIGRRVAAQLDAAGHPTRRASRSGDPPFDWADPTTWSAVLDGVSRMFLMAPEDVDVDPAFVEQATQADVRRIVLLSGEGVEEMGEQRLLDAEQVVKHSRAEWTILRPNWFDQNFDEGFFADEVRAGTVHLPVGDLRLAFVHADDIAAVAVAALTTNGHAGTTLEVRGPDALSFADAVATISRHADREVDFDGTADGYRQFQQTLGADTPTTEGAIAAFESLRRRGDDVPNDVVKTMTGRHPISFETYAASAADTWRR